MIVDYQIQGEELAKTKPKTSKGMCEKAELSNRWYKCLKLAAAFAWLDDEPEMLPSHYEAAMALAEDSSESCKAILNQPPAYQKLVEYLQTQDKPSSHTDLLENLNFYPANANAQKALWNLAIAYAWKNNVSLKNETINNVEFLSAVTYEMTDLNNMICSYNINNGDKSNFTSYSEAVSFDKLCSVAKAPEGTYWCTHKFLPNELGHQHRLAKNALEPFNMIVLDIDGTCTIDTVKTILNDVKYCIYTTKSNKVGSIKNPNGVKDYFRVIIPISRVVSLAGPEYSKFMENVQSFLPFESDSACKDIARMWESGGNDSEVYIHDCDNLLDPLPFIPHSLGEEQWKSEYKKLDSSKLVKWFKHTIDAKGDRNNHLFRFAKMLADSGKSPADIQSEVFHLNSLINEPLTQDEILATVVKSYTQG